MLSTIPNGWWETTPGRHKNPCRPEVASSSRCFRLPTPPPLHTPRSGHVFGIEVAGGLWAPRLPRGHVVLTHVSLDGFHDHPPILRSSRTRRTRAGPQPSPPRASGPYAACPG